MNVPENMDLHFTAEAMRQPLREEAAGSSVTEVRLVFLAMR